MTEVPFRATALDHVGIAVADVGSRLAAVLGAPSSLQEMPSGVSVGRFGPGAALELVMPTRPGNPVESFLERHGSGLHHIGLRVDEPLSELVPKLAAAGLQPIGSVVPGSDGRPSLFLHPSTTGGVLIELVEGARPT